MNRYPRRTDWWRVLLTVVAALVIAVIVYALIALAILTLG